MKIEFLGDDWIKVGPAELDKVTAAYLINLGAKAQRENARVMPDDGYSHVPTWSIEWDDIDPLQVLRQAAEKGE